EAGREQLRVARGEAAVPADVHVPALLGGDHADILAAGLRAFSRASRDAQLQLVRCAEPPIAQLETHGHADRVEHSVTAPGRPDTGLDGAQRLAVGLTGFESGVDEPPPDLGKLLQ